MDKTKTENITDSILEHLKRTLSHELFNHCVRTCDYALKLNRELSLGLDETKVEIAALLHDMAKEYSVRQYFDIANQYGYVFDGFILNNSKLMHGVIGAFEAKKLFEIDDDEILSAIAKHTVGCSDMNNLDLLIFVADKIEPGRKFPGADRLCKLIEKDFLKGCLEVFRSNKEFVLSKGVDYHPDGNRAMERLKKRIEILDYQEKIEESGKEQSDDHQEMTEEPVKEQSDDHQETTEESGKEKSDEINGVLNAGEKKKFIRTLISIDSYIIICAILAILISFLGSTVYGLYVFYTGIDPSSVTGSGKHPPSYYFNGREELLFLMAGLDEVEHRSRTDALILAKLDFKRQKLKLISIPRDTYVEIPGTVSNYWDRINAAYTRGGKERLLKANYNLTGHYPDFLILINYEGFKTIIDLIGGVEMDVEKNMNYDDNAGGLHIHIQKGLQVLNGEDSLGYVRYRQDIDGDFSRMRRQQNFGKAFFKSLKNPGNAFKAGKIFSAIAQCVDITVIESENEDFNITDKKLKFAQYIAIEKVIKNVPPENMQNNTIPISKEGIVDKKWVLIPDYAEFDIMMAEFFNP